MPCLPSDGSLGSCDGIPFCAYYEPLSTITPSNLVCGDVVSPLMRGLFGLEPDATGISYFSPHIPADWTSFASETCGWGRQEWICNMRETRKESPWSERRRKVLRTIIFRPAAELARESFGLEVNGRSVPFSRRANEVDQHVLVSIPFAEVPPYPDSCPRYFGLAYASAFASAGAASSRLADSFRRRGRPTDRSVDSTSRTCGHQCELFVRTPERSPHRRAKLMQISDGNAKLVFELPRTVRSLLLAR